MTPAEALAAIERAKSALEEVVLRTEGPNAWLDEQREIVESALDTLAAAFARVERLEDRVSELEQERDDARKAAIREANRSTDFYKRWQDAEYRASMAAVPPDVALAPEAGSS